MKYRFGFHVDLDDGSLTPVTKFDDHTWVFDTGAASSHRAAPGLESLLGMDLLGATPFAVYPERAEWETDVEPPADAFRHELMRPPGALQPWFPIRAGTEQVQACFDTGASLTVVDTRFAAEHQDWVTPTSDVAPGTAADGTDMPAVHGTLAPLRIGGLDFAAGPCIIADLGAWSADSPWPLHVLLGWPIVAQANWWIDSPANAWAVWR